MLHERKSYSRKISSNIVFRCILFLSVNITNIFVWIRKVYYTVTYTGCATVDGVWIGEWIY
jgi:hypothetical protein